MEITIVNSVVLVVLGIAFLYSVLHNVETDVAEAETCRKKAIIEAEKKASVAKIQYETKIKLEETKHIIATIENEKYLAKEKCKFDAEFYQLQMSMWTYAVMIGTVMITITIVYGSILRPSSNNWASYRRLKWQIAALFL
jgi:hypothetical protein